MLVRERDESLPDYENAGGELTVTNDPQQQDITTPHDYAFRRGRRVGMNPTFRTSARNACRSTTSRTASPRAWFRRPLGPWSVVTPWPPQPKFRESARPRSSLHRYWGGLIRERSIDWHHARRGTAVHVSESLVRHTDFFIYCPHDPLCGHYQRLGGLFC